jgi:hypothetical protein
MVKLRPKNEFWHQAAEFLWAWKLVLVVNRVVGCFLVKIYWLKGFSL